MKNRIYCDPVRKLARSFKYQHIYAAAKNVSAVYFFENNNDFTKIQLEFLYWLAVYNRLLQDLAAGENYLSEEVINDDLLCDCYLIWEDKVKLQEQKQNNDTPAGKSKSKVKTASAIPSVIFTKG